MSNTIKSLTIFIFLSGFILVAKGFAGMTKPAAPTVHKESTAENKQPSLYKQGVKATENKNYQKALELLEQARSREPSNPDILNTLAFTQRKLGLLEDSLENYAKALRLRPHFPEAREYLGEAYIQAALKEVETLKSYGKEGNEQREDLIKAFKEAVANLESSFLSWLFGPLVGVL